MSNPDFKFRNKKIEKVLAKLGKAVVALTPPGWGFMIFMFDFGDSGSMFYMSDARKEDVIKAMKEFIDKNEMKN